MKVKVFQEECGYKLQKEINEFLDSINNKQTRYEPRIIEGQTRYGLTILIFYQLEGE